MPRAGFCLYGVLRIHDVFLDDWSLFLATYSLRRAREPWLRMPTDEAGRPAVWRDARPLVRIDVGTALQEVEAGNLDQEYPPVPVQGREHSGL